MREETVTLPGTTPGQSLALTVLHFGEEGARPCAYIQAGLHADEAPGMLCAHHLRVRLAELEQAGKVRGHIMMTPAANPIGMGQSLLGTHHGRFALGDGVNFNRGYPALGPAAAAALEGRLHGDAAGNGALARAALQQALAAQRPVRPAGHLKQALMARALAADLVLDLHCDGEAEMHLYTQTDQADAFQPLAAWLGARALLVAEVSGEDPFDEAVSRPWAELRRRFPSLPLPEGGLAATVELRGEADVDHGLAAADAAAIIAFLGHRGHLDLPPEPAAEPLCSPTPLAGMEALEAPCAGLVVYRRALGEQVQAGDLVVEIVDPASGGVTPVAARASGRFFARTSIRFAEAGRRLGKIAGATPFRSGSLLSP